MAFTKSAYFNFSATSLWTEDINKLFITLAGDSTPLALPKTNRQLSGVRWRKQRLCILSSDALNRLKLIFSQAVASCH